MKAMFIFPIIPAKFTKLPYPPLGIGYLAAVLRAHGIQVDLIDGQILEEKEFWRAVTNLTTDVVLISATIRQMKGAALVAELIKKQNPQAKVILGGSGPSGLAAQQDDLDWSTPFDIIVIGEAENLLPLLLCRIEKNEPIDDIPNLIINESKNIIKTRVDQTLVDIKTLPWPDRTIFDEEAYLSRWRNEAKIISVHLIGSRGCPFSCSFCDKTVTGTQMRYRDPEDIASEMFFLEKRYSPDEIVFFDSVFAVHKKQVIALYQTLQKKSLKTSWSARPRVDTVDEEILEAMKAAGCSELIFGVESGSDKILRFLRKGFTREKIIQTFNLCHKINIKPGAYLMVGVPGETKRDILDTISLVKQIKPYYLEITFLTPFPNTVLYNKREYWKKEWDYERWNEFDAAAHTYKFEIDPRKAKDMIIDAYLNEVSSVMPHGELGLRAVE